MLVTLITLNVTAPQPKMHPEAAEKFCELRNTVAAGAGFDFLGRCGDIYRAPNFVSSKDGVANRSWHKTGRAFDYNQECPNLVIVSDPKNGKQYFRTYLKCARQDGSLGQKLKVRDIGGNSVEAFLFDFTAAAEAIGFKRIPAWNGWQKNYIRREFWHYQYDQNLTWDAAMLQLIDKSRSKSETVFGLNDRGAVIKKLQSKLSELGFLAEKEIDGVFGAKTKAAVEKFQSKNKLSADGIVGTETRKVLFG